MTLLRRLALKISTAVVKYASPGCKEWALGLLHETEFIESDLSAFTWALGSLRVLLVLREAPLRSLAEVPAMAREYVERKRRRASFSSPTIMLLQGLAKLLFARHWEERIGCAMVMLASLSLGISQLLERRRLDRLSSADLDEELLFFYKKELQGSLRLSFRMGTVIFSFFVYTTGMGLTLNGSGSGDLVFGLFLGLLGLMVVSLIIYRRSVDQRRLENLEAFLESDNHRPGS